ncbi:hypothetical protein L1987_64794 [Smallanthus sonchifolius]|uniref:Uncharacterized protein n=1 Tax=Smallanthus sonchifolius TaxID=185202 RepID=A0ACB9BSQ1_9ASTR|nr:hypothetical protein L1987_64794 [Smallanthus sonchifolius]
MDAVVARVYHIVDVHTLLVLRVEYEVLTERNMKSMLPDVLGNTEVGDRFPKSGLSKVECDEFSVPLA